MLKRFLKNEDGATAIEYALMAAAISLVIIGVVFAFGQEVNAMWTDLQEALAGQRG